VLLPVPIATALAAASKDAKLILCLNVDDSCFLAAAAAADEDALKSVFELKILHQAYRPIRNSQQRLLEFRFDKSIVSGALLLEFLKKLHISFPSMKECQENVASLEDDCVLTFLYTWCLKTQSCGKDLR